MIPAVKMESRHPVGGPFGREFLAFVIIAGYKHSRGRSKYS